MGRGRSLAVLGQCHSERGQSVGGAGRLTRVVVWGPIFRPLRVPFLNG